MKGFAMGGLGFLLVIFVYIFGTLALVAITPTLKFKALVLLTALLIPSADAIYGRMKLNQMCKADGGLRVYEQPSNIEGYMTNHDFADDFAVKQGLFKFSESKQKNGVCTRVTMQNGELMFEKDIEPISQFKAYLDSSVWVDSFYGYQDSVIETYPEGKVVARDRAYFFRGGWAERFLGGFSDAGSSPVGCEGSKLLSRELLLTLKSARVGRTRLQSAV